VIVVLYGLSLAELEKDKGGKVFLGAKNVVEINEMETYLKQVEKRAAK
jgi:hypothetical protein